MNGIRNREYRRIAAGIMGIMILVVLLLSVFFIAAEAGHECSEENCPICACIEHCANLQKQLGGGIAAAAVFAVSVSFLLTPLLLPVCDLVTATPVSVKIRLNN